MNESETGAIVARCLQSGSGVWVDTDMGDVDLFGDDLEEFWDGLEPGEGFRVLGILTKKETA